MGNSHLLLDRRPPLAIILECRTRRESADATRNHLEIRIYFSQIALYILATRWCVCVLQMIDVDCEY